MLTASEYEKLREVALTVGIHLAELPTVRPGQSPPPLPAGRHLVWMEIDPPKWGDSGGIASTRVPVHPR